MFQDSLDKFALQDPSFSVQYFLTGNENEVIDCSQGNVKRKDIGN